MKLMQELDTFLFSFVVPILPEMLEERIGTNPEDTQILTSIILSMNALVSIGIAPFIAHLADKTSAKNRLLTVSWAINAIGTLLNAWPAKRE
jgi:MFS family permease